MVATRVRPNVTTGQVWRQLTKCSFAVISHVTPDGDPRSSGVMYAVADRRLYVVVAPDSDFVLYGIGVPLPRMRELAAARARVPVAGT